MKDNPTTDHVMLAALETWRECRLAYRALPLNGPDRDESTEDEHGYTPEENAVLARIDGAEILLHHLEARTPQGVIAQLLIALNHIDDDRETETAIISGDMEAIFALDESLDWGVRMILSAIRSLQAMGARS